MSGIPIASNTVVQLLTSSAVPSLSVSISVDPIAPVKSSTKISVKDGYILIKEIEFKGVPINQNKVFRLGKTLN